MAMTKYQMHEIKAYFGEFFEDYKRASQEMCQEYDWATIEHYMDVEIAEDIHMALAPCSNEHFLLVYMMAHTERFGEDFVIS